MGLNIVDHIKSAFGSKESNFKKQMTGTWFSDTLPAQIYYKELVIQTCISIIANALVMSEFQTYTKGKEERKHIHYLLNVQPNKNQNATEFWNEVVSKLIYDNECLIVPINDEWFIADDFDEPTKYVYYEDLYKNVTVRGLNLNTTFVESQVIYLKLNDKSIKKLIDGLFDDYSKLLTAASKSYKKANGFKAILNIGANMPQTEESSADLEDLLNNQFKNYIEKDNSVMPLSDELKLDESKDKGPSKDTRDIRKLVDDIIEFVCMAMRIPVGMVRGDVAGISEQTDNFLMLCINPFAKLITTEINRKWYYEDEYLEKTYVKMNTQKIRLVDLEKIAKAADLLFRIGVHTINDNLELIGKEHIDEEYANEHYVTKNYNSVLNQNANLKGGEKNGKHGEENSQSGNS